MAKKARKPKEPVRLRQKALSNGNISLYLDIYRNGQRQYEFLKLYLIPETASNPTAKEQNKNVLNLANAIKAQRIIDVESSEAGIILQRSKMLLTDWLEEYKQQKSKAKKSLGLQTKIEFIKQLLNQYKRGATLGKVDKAFCEGFLSYIQNDYISERTKKHLAKNTAATYYGILNGALNAAVRKKCIVRNPMLLVEKDYKPVRPESQRVYLTFDEVKTLIETKCKKPLTKQAFLFSCFCGLRFSDIARLKWGDLTTVNGQLQADIRQKKTDSPIYLPISKNAQKWLPNRQNEADDEPIFKGIDNGWCTTIVTRWAKQAGISKHVTFHTARHTFATMLLTKGADLYTTSKLLGHKNITHTQIYAKIIDQKKVEAVNLLDNLF